MKRSRYNNGTHYFVFDALITVLYGILVLLLNTLRKTLFGNRVVLGNTRRTSGALSDDWKKKKGFFKKQLTVSTIHEEKTPSPKRVVKNMSVDYRVHGFALNTRIKKTHTPVVTVSNVSRGLNRFRYHV